MQNDIYPRFLNSQEYQQLLRKGKEMDEAGKGFFAKLQRKKFDVVRQDASGISPCLPQRYTRRQVGCEDSELPLIRPSLGPAQVS